MALLNDDALLASTNAFIPFIIIPPMAAMPWTMAKAGIALLFLIPLHDPSSRNCAVFMLYTCINLK